MYLSDLYTMFVNLARIPSLSVPAGKTKAGMPVGIQFAGAMFSEARLLRTAQAWEEEHTGFVEQRSACGIPVEKIN
jgi:aspartyl-tRNA(Asn)/glutamyl-tRNA(Gln) amidotransferase subunit A